MPAHVDDVVAVVEDVDVVDDVPLHDAAAAAADTEVKDTNAADDVPLLAAATAAADDALGLLRHPEPGRQLGLDLLRHPEPGHQ